jgi:hypothetical protein
LAGVPTIHYLFYDTENKRVTVLPNTFYNLQWEAIQEPPFSFLSYLLSITYSSNAGTAAVFLPVLEKYSRLNPQSYANLALVRRDGWKVFLPGRRFLLTGDGAYGKPAVGKR